ncbi:hypothetical protein BO79DRAFT_241128 [Aspergillus costaricaensis CBS 115574]|uniref:Uncharacterized protein n=1 Tax=Aspergillus costaricaensis CBS 115574 TaxID=1448317 RepID=A0ACD1I130_9EURO|nr:hypothetical protein BO79DRAFT_241128 [Aspergillus costaricaensis CBS 115574]RAK83498.1 hypothetical protein BO79DRAFT_241128 [Aspergillus costaricaensis CBS 115574]
MTPTMKNPDIPEATETPITAAGSSLLSDALADADWPLLVALLVVVEGSCEVGTVNGLRKVSVITDVCSVLKLVGCENVLELEPEPVSEAELELEVDGTVAVVVVAVFCVGIDPVGMTVAVIVACVRGKAPSTESQMSYKSELKTVFIEHKDRLQRNAASPSV